MTLPTVSFSYGTYRLSFRRRGGRAQNPAIHATANRHDDDEQAELRPKFLMTQAFVDEYKAQSAAIGGFERGAAIRQRTRTHSSDTFGRFFREKFMSSSCLTPLLWRVRLFR